MKRLLIAIGLAAVIPACHGGEQPATTVVGVPPDPVTPPATTTLLVQATNYDFFDYAIWIEWQDASGNWLQTYLFSVYGDPTVGPTMNFDIILAETSATFYVLLADPWGTLYDSYLLSLPVATSVDVRFNIVDGFLYRTL